MKNKALCVIDGTNTSQLLQNLLNQRCVAALPFAGRYRLVDFALSNAVHSGITNVSIFPDGDYHSLSDHIRSGKFWGLDRKVDGLFLLPPKKEVNIFYVQGRRMLLCIMLILLRPFDLKSLLNLILNREPM